MDRHRLDAHFVAGAVDAQRDLAAIGDEDLVDRHRARAPVSPVIPAKAGIQSAFGLRRGWRLSLNSRFRGNDDEKVAIT
jgi:hypothetical protein